MRQAIDLPLFIVPFFAGLALFCAGLAWGMNHFVLRVLWGVTGLGCLWVVVRAWRDAGSRKPFTREETDETH